MNKRGFNIFWLLLLVPIFFLTAVFAASYYLYKEVTPEKFLNLLQSDLAKKDFKIENQELVNDAPTLLGFVRPVTYLILFQNNTELRPSGGFIGSYALVTIDKGKMELLAVDGTENLDRNTPNSWRPEPPAPIKDNLKVDRWYFRDSNWSPDFSVSAKKALELYKGEEGLAADKIDAVISITPTVLEEVLKRIGPIVIQGLEFKADNVTEKLEYEVEYGYDKKGVDFKDRKQIIKSFMLELINRLKFDAFLNYKSYLSLTENLINQKQIVFYALDEKLQAELSKNGWSGEVINTEGDYLLWVDANMASLKTDLVIERNLTYSIVKQTNGRYLAKAEMLYKHNGKFDWRTTRYRTYARIFVPIGSELVSTKGAMKTDRSSLPGKVDQGSELNKQWFGGFISIEPGQKKNLSFSYYLPEVLTEKIDNGLYTLYVQKQLGIISSGLTLDLNFGKTIVTSTPVSDDSTVFKFEADLNLDKQVTIKF